MSNDDIKAHFEQFGEVVEVVRPVDKQKNNEPKTFCFITFAKEDAAKQLVKQVFEILFSEYSTFYISCHS